MSFLKRGRAKKSIPLSQKLSSSSDGKLGALPKRACALPNKKTRRFQSSFNQCCLQLQIVISLVPTPSHSLWNARKIAIPCLAIPMLSGYTKNISSKSYPSVRGCQCKRCATYVFLPPSLLWLLYACLRPRLMPSPLFPKHPPHPRMIFTVAMRLPCFYSQRRTPLR